MAADDYRRHPGRGGLVTEVLKDATQDDGSTLVPWRAPTVYPYEGTVLAIDHRTGSEVEPGELVPCPHRPGERVDARREAERASSMMGIDESLKVVTRCDLRTATGRPEPGA